MIKYKNIYFIGIGGIGMSAIARMLKSRGATVSGSDIAETEVTRGLKKESVKVNLKQVAENLSDDIDCVVYTTAVPKENPEFIEAKKRKLPIYSYAQMLGELSAGLETVAITGAHGKTTTTAMISAALRGAGRRPHVIVGSLLPELKSNYIRGEETILITEACEYKRTFLNLSPKYMVITNIDSDHLDYYKDLADIQSAFVELADKLPADGKIICDPSLPNLKPIVEKYNHKIIDYIKFIKDVPSLKVIGKHNILNAAASLAITSMFVDEKSNNFLGAKKGLAEFSGTWRRLEPRGKTSGGAILYDDYAHHPDEIRASLKALHEAFLEKKIVVFFQPHLYSRTKTLFDDFVKVFDEFLSSKAISELYLMPIYAAREPNDPTVSSKILADNIPSANHLNTFDEAIKIISIKKTDSLVVTMGAGDVYKILDML